MFALAQKNLQRLKDIKKEHAAELKRKEEAGDKKEEEKAKEEDKAKES